MRTSLAFWLMTAWAGIPGCSAGDRVSAPASAHTTHGVAVAPGDSGRITIVDFAGRIVARTQLEIRASLASASARQILYLATVLPDAHRELVAIDLRTNTVSWRLPASGSAGQVVIDGVEIWAPDVMSFTPDSSALVLSFARQGGRGGIATLDVSTRQVAHFAPIVHRAGLAAIAPTPRFPHGAIVVGGTRDSMSTTSGVFFLDPTTLIAVDSIGPNELGTTGDILQQVVPTRDGAVLFLYTNRHIVRFDTGDRHATALVDRPVEGSLWISPDQNTLILPDAGHGPNAAGSGRIYVYEAETLRLRGTIQLPPEPDGRSRTIVAAAMTPDSASAFVTTGGSRVGPTFPVGPAALVQLDLNTMTVTRVTPLSDWGVGRPFVF